MHRKSISGRPILGQIIGITYLPNFWDAIGAAGSGPLHAWINGACFTSREARPFRSDLASDQFFALNRLC
jgi:hypothetical protein